MSKEVQTMFGRIAPKYDRANTVLSLGQDGSWRRIAIRQARLARGGKALDVACGTGPLTRRLARVVGPTGAVTGVDFTQEMLDVAQGQEAHRKAAPITYQWADAMDLPFEDDTFDAATIAFGIRNVDEPVTALKQMLRVVRPGGRVVVLEFGQPKGLLGAGYRTYARHVMPRVGGWITGDREAYEYLPRTAAAFPAGDAFLALMVEAGAQRVESRPILGGLVWCYTAVP